MTSVSHWEQRVMESDDWDQRRQGATRVHFSAAMISYGRSHASYSMTDQWYHLRSPRNWRRRVVVVSVPYARWRNLPPSYSGKTFSVKRHFGKTFSVNYLVDKYMFPFLVDGVAVNERLTATSSRSLSSASLSPFVIHSESWWKDQKGVCRRSLRLLIPVGRRASELRNFDSHLSRGTRKWMHPCTIPMHRLWQRLAFGQIAFWLGWAVQRGSWTSCPVYSFIFRLSPKIHLGSIVFHLDN